MHTDGSTDDYTYDEAATCRRTRAPTAAACIIENTTVCIASRASSMPKAAMWKRDYDAQGHLTEEIDPLGHKTEYAYDKAGRPVRIIDAKGGVKVLAYSPSGATAPATPTVYSAKTSRWE